MNKTIKKEYIKGINKELEKTNDLALIDLIFKILVKSNATENEQEPNHKSWLY